MNIEFITLPIPWIMTLQLFKYLITWSVSTLLVIAHKVCLTMVSLHLCTFIEHQLDTFPTLSTANFCLFQCQSTIQFPPCPHLTLYSPSPSNQIPHPYCCPFLSTLLQWALVSHQFFFHSGLLHRCNLGIVQQLLIWLVAILEVLDIKSTIHHCPLPKLFSQQCSVTPWWYDIELVNPIIIYDFITTTMWTHGIILVWCIPHKHFPKWEKD